VVYILHARTDEPQKPRKTVYYRTVDEAVFSLCCAELRRAVPSRASLVATQRCDKYISAAANQHPTVQNAVFSEALPRSSLNKSVTILSRVRVTVEGV
jgi:hypothetical protein